MIRIWTCLIALLAFAACSGDGKPDLAKGEPLPEPEVKTEHLICPQVAILREAEEIMDYGGKDHSEENLVSKARLTKISGDCGYRKRKDESGIDIQFTFQAMAAKGPMFEGNNTSFSYFVAIVDPSDQVISKKTMTAAFKFSKALSLAELNEPLRVFIPVLSESGLMSGPAYRVLIGFEPRP